MASSVCGLNERASGRANVNVHAGSVGSSLTVTTAGVGEQPQRRQFLHLPGGGTRAHVVAQQRTSEWW